MIQNSLMMLGGFRVFANTLCTTLEVQRVRGGYMNHWLIRQEVRVPSAFISEAEQAIYCHPDILQKLKEKLK